MTRQTALLVALSAIGIAGLLLSAAAWISLWREWRARRAARRAEPHV